MRQAAHSARTLQRIAVVTVISQAGLPVSSDPSTHQGQTSNTHFLSHSHTDVLDKTSLCGGAGFTGGLTHLSGPHAPLSVPVLPSSDLEH